MRGRSKLSGSADLAALPGLRPSEAYARDSLIEREDTAVMQMADLKVWAQRL